MTTDTTARTRRDSGRLTATAEELAALAWGLAGTAFPGTGPTVLDGASGDERAALAAALVRGLERRGVVEVTGDAPAVAPRYEPLVSAVLDPDEVLSVHRLGPAREHRLFSVAGDDVVVHRRDRQGFHRLERLRDDGDVAGAVLSWIDLPPCREPDPAWDEVQLRRSEFLGLCAGDGGEAPPARHRHLLTAVRSAAMAFVFRRLWWVGDTVVGAALAGLPAGADGLWLLEADPGTDPLDGDRKQGDPWLLARPAPVAAVEDWLAREDAGSHA